MCDKHAIADWLTKQVKKRVLMDKNGIDCDDDYENLDGTSAAIQHSPSHRSKKKRRRGSRALPPQPPPWSAEGLQHDQTLIFYSFLNALKRWLDTKDKSTFVPLRLTVPGKAGTGKSTVIRKIRAICRRVFG